MSWCSWTGDVRTGGLPSDHKRNRRSQCAAGGPECEADTTSRLIGFEELGDSDKFTSKALEFRLQQSGQPAVLLSSPEGGLSILCLKNCGTRLTHTQEHYQPDRYHCPTRCPWRYWAMPISQIGRTRRTIEIRLGLGEERRGSGMDSRREAGMTMRIIEESGSLRRRRGGSVARVAAVSVAGGTVIRKNLRGVS